jgi:hypothetical protein
MNEIKIMEEDLCEAHGEWTLKLVGKNKEELEKIKELIVELNKAICGEK